MVAVEVVVVVLGAVSRSFMVDVEGEMLSKSQSLKESAHRPATVKTASCLEPTRRISVETHTFLEEI